MKFSEVVGRCMRTRRELAHVDLAEMARHQGLSTSGWSRVETGVSSVTVEHVQKAAIFLGIKASDILKEAEEIVRTQGPSDGASSSTRSAR